jgi:hypothetical protein
MLDNQVKRLRGALRLSSEGRAWKKTLSSAWPTELSSTGLRWAPAAEDSTTVTSR